MAGNDHRRDKSRSEAWAICDRTGTRYPMREMVVEPGTGYLVHKKVNDGPWNAVDHPQGNLGKYVTFGDPYPIEDARLNPADALATTAEYLTNTDNTAFTDDSGVQLELRNSDI